MRHLSRIAREPEIEVVWDLEASSWSNIICASLVTSEGEVHSSPTFEGLIEWADTRGLLRRAVRWWAHWGGIYDHLLVLPKLLAAGWSIRESSTGPSGGLATIRAAKGHRELQLRDSSRVLTDSVAKIGGLVGLPKIKEDRTALEELPWGRLSEYCERDCHVVMRGLIYLKDLLRSYGGVLKDTLASSAASIIRSRCVPADEWGWTVEDDQWAYRAYGGGRTEVQRHACENGRIADINSAYPAAMVRPLPTRLIERGRGPIRQRDGDSIYLAVARVQQPHERGFLHHRREHGPLKGKLLFPRGEWVGAYTLEELDALGSVAGGDYKVIEWARYAAEPWLEPVMSKWYERRKNSDNELERYLLKLLMNSPYGKLVEHGEYETISTQWSEVLRAEREGRGWNVRDLKNGIRFFVIEQPSLGPLRHAAAAATVTARTRIQLGTALIRAERPAYADTDSIHGHWSFETDAKQLGAWKLEAEYASAEYLAPKLYAIEVPGKPLYVRAKGFPVPRRPDLEGMTDDEAEAAMGAHAAELRQWWGGVKAGKPVFREKTVLFRTLLARGDLTFTREGQHRARSLADRPGKRARSGVETCAWAIEELQAMEAPETARNRLKASCQVKSLAHDDCDNPPQLEPSRKPSVRIRGR